MVSRSQRRVYYPRRQAPRRNRRRCDIEDFDTDVSKMEIFLFSVIIFILASLSTDSFVEETSKDVSDTLVVRNSCPSTSERHLSLEIIISPTISHLSCIYNFLTPMHDVLDTTDSILNVNSPIDLQFPYELLPYNNSTNVSIIDYTNLNFLPDLSVWNDRSILIFATHRLYFSSEPTCPEVYVCAIPNSGHNSTTCHTDLGEVSGSCKDEISDPYFFMFPLATGLKVSVNNVGEYPGIHNNSMHIIVTSGYRLPPGVFTCPSGFFACDTFDKINERRNSPLQWPYRICLPIRLWCDKVLNCPISGSDERNCSSSPPMSFPHTKFQIKNEYRMLNDVLNQFEKNTSLLEFVGYRKKTSEQPITMLLFAYVNTFWLSLILPILILIFIITILLCVYKLLKRKREAGTVRVAEVKDYPTNSESCNDDTLKNSINNNHYSENAFSGDQLNKEETCNDDFQNNNNSDGAVNNDYHKFLPSDVNYLNGYLNSLGNQEIAPLINVTEKQ
ncbi:unnamed protein product [Schistosoma spindalis]|nr:unnamed protein product [Schistosoma spindale]